MLLKFFLTSLLSLWLVCSGAQQIESSSRLDQNLKARHCDALYKLAFDRVDANLIEGALYAQKSLLLAQELNDSLRMVKAVRILSWPLRKMGLNDSVEAMLNRYLPAARRFRDLDQLHSILNRLTIINIDRSRYDKALHYAFEVLEVDNITRNPIDLQKSLNNLGLIYFKLDDRNRAIRFFRRAALIQTDDFTQLQGINANLSLSYAYNNMIDSATFFINSIQHRTNEDTITVEQSSIVFATGLLAYQNRNYQKAEECFWRSLEICKRLKYERLIIDNVNYLFTICKQTDQVSKLQGIVVYMEKILKHGYTYHEGICLMNKNLIGIYSDGRNNVKLLELQHDYIALRDSLYNASYITNLMRAEGASIEQQHRAKIESQTKMMELNAEVIAWQRYFGIFLALTICLISLVLYVVNKNYRLKRFANVLLEERIVDRTIELEENKSQLLLALEDKKVQIEKLSKDGTSFIITIIGLSMLFRREELGPDSIEYLNRIHNTSEEALRYFTHIRNSNGLSDAVV